MNYMTTQFRDKRTGEIVEQFPIHEIEHFEEVITAPISAYEQKQEVKHDHYQELAEKNRAASDASFQGARDAVSDIPFGQPILVGHHSEKRHRAALNRQDQRMRKGCELSNKADYYASKAAGVGKGGISSDDPEAITKLQAKIDKAEKSQAQMKASNKIIRSRKDVTVRLINYLNISEGTALKMQEPDFCGRVGFPAYALQNNNANIRRMKERIEALKQAPTETTSEKIGAVEIVTNTEINRTQVFFPSKPSVEIRQILKSHGFRWSRYEGAWQRHISTQAQYWAEIIAKQVQS